MAMLPLRRMPARPQARIAANRAFLAGIGLVPEAMHDGVICPLEPGDPLTLQTARRLAAQAAVATAERQVRAAGAQRTRIAACRLPSAPEGLACGEGAGRGGGGQRN
jgi:hypothetical protein